MTQANVPPTAFDSAFAPRAGSAPIRFAPAAYQVEEPKAPHRGLLILILGIVSIGMCALTGPAAWYLANQDLPKIRYGNMDPEGYSMTIAGKVCGILVAFSWRCNSHGSLTCCR